MSVLPASSPTAWSAAPLSGLSRADVGGGRGAIFFEGNMYCRLINFICFSCIGLDRYAHMHMSRYG